MRRKVDNLRGRVSKGIRDNKKKCFLEDVNEFRKGNSRVHLMLGLRRRVLKRKRINWLA